MEDPIKAPIIFLVSIALGLLALGYAIVIYESARAMYLSGPSIFLRTAWSPGRGEYGLLAPLVGTLYVATLSSLVALALSIPLALLMVEYIRGTPSRVAKAFVEASAGVPTVVYGLAGLWMAPVITNSANALASNAQWFPLTSCRAVTEVNAAVAVFVMAIAMLPYATSMVAEAYGAVPRAYVEAAYSLGLMRSEVAVLRLGLARQAIVAAWTFTFTRALTETTIMAMLTGNQLFMSACLLAPLSTVPALIANNFGYSSMYPGSDSALYAGALVLLLISTAAAVAGSKAYSRWRRLYA